MNVIKIHATLPNRDASLLDLAHGRFENIPLLRYIHHGQSQSDSVAGHYASLQGPTITPQPFWCVEFTTISREVSGKKHIQPKTEDQNYIVATARWANVEGTGSTKQKWRGLKISGPLSIKNLYGVVTSSWLVPFCIAYRFLVHIPFKLKSSKETSGLTPVASENKTLDSFIYQEEQEGSQGIKKWTKLAQNMWKDHKTEKSSHSVLDYLDYHGKMVNQIPNTIRVVHTRSRKLYAAILDPSSETALGFNLSKARIGIRIDEKLINQKQLKLQGCIIDNMLHYIPVKSIKEAYWLVGLLNAKSINDKIMKLAGGERGQEYVPSIYSLPAKFLNERGIVFNIKNEVHNEISHIAKQLESDMGDIIRKYMMENKNIDMNSLDDTDASPEIPSTIETPYTARLNEKFPDKVDKLNSLVDKMLKDY